MIEKDMKIEENKENVKLKQPQKQGISVLPPLNKAFQDVATEISKMNIESNDKVSIVCREQEIPSSPIRKEKRKEENKKVSEKDYYVHKENKKLMQQYGSDVYNFSQLLEQELQLKSNFLDKHKVNPSTRTRMVDWMIEVFYAYKSDPPTFFLAIDILDRYLSSTKNISDNDIHLLGVVCIFIASKMEDLIPLRMIHIVKTISHNKFTERQIQKKEAQILNAIDFKLVTISTYDFIQTLFSDLAINNSGIISDLKMEKHINSLNNVCIFLAKLMTLDEKFYMYYCSLKAIACVICGFDIVRSNSKTLNTEMIDFLSQWINFVISSSPFDSELINSAYNSLSFLYKTVETAKENGMDQFNLSKSHSFYFY